ncbi:DEAD/DEAH box helicase [Alteromonas sp. A081]|uniref:DEAD/DEAH box helicase n=1 Tax=Alteromonas sp. A081 TaxID=3410269 RepID=UPI003B980243
MDNNYFSSLTKDLVNRSANSTIGLLNIANEPLTSLLKVKFNSTPGEPGCLLGDPVFEGKFGWKEADMTMQKLSGNLLAPSLVKAMENPPKDLKKDYEFSSKWSPYTHQVEAWNALTAEKPKSVLVTSGTGSGKTECFLVPVLNRLQQEAEKGSGLQGCRALFLYPLNALINSQRDRLRAWTHGLNKQVRFSLYNGETPNFPLRKHSEYPREVDNRKDLRAYVPPIIVTNATMLEYMLVRKDDKPIIDQSKGKLEWIILDEAHTYLGSQAAELSLLLRRVVSTFEVDPKNIRFVATSATIGGKDSKAELQKFLADIAGVASEQVVVIGGEREFPSLPRVEANNLSNNDISQLDSSESLSQQRFEALSSNPSSLKLRELFVKSDPPVANLSEVCTTLFDNKANSKDKKQEALNWLDICSGTDRKLENGRTDTFLPLRAHLFHTTMSGLWACVDKNCSHKEKQLDDPRWKFGSVYFDRREKCDCGAPVYELKICNDCSDVHLHAKRLSDGRLTLTDDFEVEDDFSLELERSEDDESELDDTPIVDIGKVVISGVPGKQSIIDRLSRTNSELDSDEPDAIPIHLNQSIDSPVRCPSCNAPNNNDYLFRPARLGAPSHITTAVQTLLEYAPEGKDLEAHGPFNGRRLITFTDSRQGTARIAAKLQQDAERNRARSLIYHHLLRAQTDASGNPEDMLIAEKTIADLRKGIEDNPALKSTFEALIDKELMNLAKLSGNSNVSVPWQSLEASLANGEKSISKWMMDVYKGLAPKVFTQDVGVERISRMVLEREFLRRPKRANSSETMGLVKLNYPNLNKVNELPPELLGKKSLDSWKDFLKICIDFFVRSNFAVEVSQSTQNWLGEKVRQKELNPQPGLSRKEAGWTVVWPIYNRHAGRLPTLVNLLRAWLSLDLETKANQILVSNLLKQAFEVLKSDKVGIFTKTGEGNFILELRKQVEFSLITNAWKCPISNKVLDTTLDGISPYLPSDADPKNYVCQPIKFPIYDAPFGKGDSRKEELVEAKKWLLDNADVEALRSSGIWTDLNDRIVEQVPFIRAVEHSAQLSGSRLRQYEDDFKKGKLNILSCSTTMEMGVDIGGISVVAMNNAPPHPANYLQRSGRAGRRGENRAVAFTLCKQNPHGNLIFSNTKWPFTTPTFVPKVTFQSQILVQRHVNALCLAFFLNTFLSDQDLTKLNCVAFFGDAESEELTPAKKFLDLLNGGSGAWTEAHLSKLTVLTRGTCLARMTADELLIGAGKAFNKICENWLNGRNRLVKEKQGLLRGDKRAEKAVSIQITRVECEYLLSELATSGFLPGYGFPTHIANFNTINLSQLQTASEENKNRRNDQLNRHRIDNKMMARDFPSRDMVAAIREFAPGAEVVIDGQVFKSGGILLNWKVPTDQDKAKEPQGFKYAWRCHSCGASGSSHLLKEANECSECGKPIESENIKTYTEPSGFAVDIYEATHNDISRPKYLPVREPWITGNGEWVNLVNEDLGRFRSTSNGHVFHFNDGNTSQGYSICLECGRSEPSNSDEFSQFSSALGHKRLRGGKDNDSSICPGSFDDWKIKKNVSFGVEDRTDVLEVQIKDPNSSTFVNNKTIALSAAVALRQAATELLGIAEEEVGITVSPSLVDGMEAKSIYLFDRAGGGSGFMSSVSGKLPELLKKAINKLHCKANCESACHHCLLSYDTQFQAKELDRKAALEFFNEHWLSLLKLDLRDKLFGESTELETRPIRAAIADGILASSNPILRIFLKGETADWDLLNRDFRKFLMEQSVVGCDIQLVVDEAKLENADTEIIEQLNSYVKSHVVSLVKGNDVDSTLIELQSDRFVTKWGCRQPGDNLGVPGHLFFETGNSSPIVKATYQQQLTPHEAINLSAYTRHNTSVDSNACEIEIRQEINGFVSGFGSRFWDFIKSKAPAQFELFENPDTAKNIVKVSYYDRYLNTPLMVSLLSELLEGLRDVAVRWDTPEILIHSAEPSSSNYKAKLWDNFGDSESRDRAIQKVLAYADIKAFAYTKEKRNLPHYRRLEVFFSDGSKLLVRLDQGLGYWIVDNNYRVPSYELSFDFSNSDPEEALSSFKVKIANESERHGTQIVVRFED